MAYVTLIYNNQTYKYGIQFTQNNFFFYLYKRCENPNVNRTLLII